jgi:hypothetical protein
MMLILFARPNERLLRALITSPKRINRRRPNLSASAPPRVLPPSAKNEFMPSRIPACVMPTPNFCVTYKEKKGKRIVPPKESIKRVMTTIQNSRGNSWYVFWMLVSILFKIDTSALE